MKKFFILITLYTLLFSCKKVKYDAGFLNPESIKKEGQMHPNWCYAAVTQMVLSYYDINISQADIVNELNDTSGCGEFVYCLGGGQTVRVIPNNSPINRLCIEAYNDKEGLIRFLSSKIRSKNVTYKQTLFTIEKVKKVLKEKTGPVVVNLQLGGGMEHAILIIGYVDFGKDGPLAFNVINPGNSNCKSCEYVMLYDKKNKEPIGHFSSNTERYTMNNNTIIFIPEPITI